MLSALTRAALLVAVEGVVVLGGAVAYAVAGATGGAQDPAGAELGALLIGATGVALLAAAAGLHRRRRWARGPVVAVQVLAVLVAASYLVTPAWPVAVAVAVVALAVTGQLLTPGSRRALDDSS